MKCPTCSKPSKGDMLCSGCAYSTAFYMDRVLEEFAYFEDLPFANMQRQVDKVRETLGQVAAELRVYAKKQES